MFFIGVVAINRLSLEENGGHIHLEHATSGLLLGRSEVLRSLRHYLRAHTIDRLEKRGVERKSARRSSLKGTREGHRQSRRTLEPFERQRCGNFLETGWSAHGLFRAHRGHLELTWTCNTNLQVENDMGGEVGGGGGGGSVGSPTTATHMQLEEPILSLV